MGRRIDRAACELAECQLATDFKRMPGNELLAPDSDSFSSAGFLPACANVMICCRNSAGYGILVFGISDSFSHRGGSRLKWGNLSSTAAPRRFLQCV